MSRPRLSTNARIIREKVPTAQLREFPDPPAAFQALVQGQVDAYTNDGIQLYGRKAKAPTSSYTAKAIEALTAGTLIYLAMCVAIAAVMARIEWRLVIPGLIARVGAG